MFTYCKGIIEGNLKLHQSAKKKKKRKAKEIIPRVLWSILNTDQTTSMYPVLV